MSKNIYLVLSYNLTAAGTLICLRASMKFWNRYKGDVYSHSSISLNRELTHMMSFARKKTNNPFISGLVKEDIHKKVFKRSGRFGRMAVAEIPVSSEQYDYIRQYMKNAWCNRDKYKYDLKGLGLMMISARGTKTENRYFCSHWIAEILQKSGVYDFGKRELWNVRPFDFYDIFQDYIIYEGPTLEYDKYIGAKK